MRLDIAAGDELHHQIVTFVLDEIVEQAGDARMRQQREHASLAREILDGFLLGDAVADDHLLAGDRAIREAGVVGHVDAAHAADAEHLVDAIATVEHVADIEGLTRRSFGAYPRRREGEKRGAANCRASPRSRGYAIGSMTSLRNVLPMMISSPLFKSTGEPGCRR